MKAVSFIDASIILNVCSFGAHFITSGTSSTSNLKRSEFAEEGGKLTPFDERWSRFPVISQAPNNAILSIV